ncbi:hypothetical protein BCR42DRAFT_127551 [Absidia repens]|uniref:Uncharacterized protein n=1 Tax=Absidia repens TaxID=90262 RepID=A0A1X2IVC9_9FUNG|nr:hypothetical protein BCR42DRAFT_127551 [Absidia repens]
MAYPRDTNTCLWRMDSDSIGNAKKILQQVASLLEKSRSAEIFGEAVSYSTRPWVLLFCPAIEALETAIHEEFATRNNPKLLESIRICCVQDMYELRKVLACIHLPPGPESKNDIISWMMQEKFGQPPILMCVVDLLDILLATDRSYDQELPISERHLYVRYAQLADTLSLLVETCAYFNNYGRKTWENAFGVDIPLTPTALLVTDNGYLATRPEIDNQQELEQLGVKTRVLESLYRIIVHYLGVVI